VRFSSGRQSTGPDIGRTAEKVTNRAILSADEIGRFLDDTRQIFVGRFCRQIKSANFVVRLTSP